MKKRMGGSKSQPTLPVTEADAERSTGMHGSEKRRKKSRRLTPFQKYASLLAAFLCGGVMVSVVQRRVLGVGETNVPSRRLMIAEEERELPLQDFPSLQYALRNSEITLLYFAASWCPMSTPVTDLLDELFRDVLLEPPEDDQPQDLLQRQGLSLVYVSSDRYKEEMEDYIQSNWMAVPFDSEERAALKRRFKTCAKRELEDSGMEREHEIPTLIALSGTTHQVLTVNGVKDLGDYGLNAVDHWMELDRLSLALRDKYEYSSD
jgi:hypothetical protein